MIGIDTNVLVRFLVQDDETQARSATKLFGSLTAADPGYLPLVTLTEVFWVLTRTYKLAAVDVVGALSDLIDSDEIVCQCEQQARTALRQARNGADLGDALLAAAAADAGCAETVTFDKAAADKIGMRRLR